MLKEFHESSRHYRRRHGVLAAYLPELHAIRAGLRVATQVTLSPQEWATHRPALERFCRRAELHLSVHEKDGLPRVIVSSHPLPPPDGETRQDNPDNRFGYPGCCVSRFLASSVGHDFVARTRVLVDREHTFPFEVNPFLVTTPFHLTRHFPCSLHCAPTRELASAMLSLIRRAQPGLAADIERFGRTPVLFTDVCGMGISLMGTRSGDSVRYRGLFFDGHPANRLTPSNPHDLEPIGASRGSCAPWRPATRCGSSPANATRRRSSSGAAAAWHACASRRA